MNKKHAFILSFLLTGLIASNIYLFSSLRKTESVIVSRAIDGDTIELEDGRVIRLVNVNAPEKNHPASHLATNYLKTFVNKTVKIETKGKDKYYRTLARVYYKNYINFKLVEKGLANKFLVDESELKIFAEAEQSAVEDSLGIWTKSKYYGCFNSNINQKEELIILENLCESINLKDWTLKDEGRKIHALPDITLGKLNIYSGTGNNNKSLIFLNYEKEIWDNDRDTLYLFDSEGSIAHHYHYGY